MVKYGLSCQNAGFIMGRLSGERATHFVVERRSQGCTNDDRARLHQRVPQAGQWNRSKLPSERQVL